MVQLSIVAVPVLLTPPPPQYWMVQLLTVSVPLLLIPRRRPLMLQLLTVMVPASRLMPVRC